MAKTKVQKEEIIKNLEDKFAKMKAMVIVDYKGLKVKETQELRKALRAKDVDFAVSKNTLTKIVLKKQGIAFENESIFKKPIAIAFAYSDEVAPAKEITLFAKKNEAIEILGGILEKKYIDAGAVAKLAALPSKEQLQGQMVRTIAAPLAGFVNVFAGNLRGLVNVLNARREKLEV